MARLLECRAYAAAADVFVALTEQAVRSVPRRSGSTTASSSTPRTCWPGSRPTTWPQAYLRGVGERPVPRVDLSHVTVDTVSVVRGRGRAGRRCPAERATSFRDLVAGLHDPHRGHRALPGAARAVQARAGSPSARATTFGDLHIDWLADDELAGVSSGRGLAELGGYEIDDYEG